MSSFTRTETTAILVSIVIPLPGKQKASKYLLNERVKESLSGGVSKGTHVGRISGFRVIVLGDKAQMAGF